MVRKVFLLLLFLPLLLTAQPSSSPAPPILFRYGSEVIYNAYQDNAEALVRIRQLAEQNRAAIESNSAHLCIVSVIPQREEGNTVAINFASIRGAVVRQWLKESSPWLTNECFAFYVAAEARRNAVQVLLNPTPIESEHNSDLFFTLDKTNIEAIDQALSRYQSIPFQNNQSFVRAEVEFDIVNPALDPTKTHKIEGAIDEQVLITLYYRVSKDNLDPTYLTNAKTLAQIDSLLNLPSAAYIDTLRITAFASPEGDPIYNLKLSERRANSMRNYIMERYPKFANREVIAEGSGINWKGLRRMVEADTHLPNRAELLMVLTNAQLTQRQRQEQVERINGGRLYRDHLLPRYYPQLRSGASLFVAYNPGMPVDIDFEPLNVIVDEPAPPPPPPVVVIPVAEPPMPAPPPPPMDTIHYRRPIAVKTNMLFDLATLFNVELELPVGKQFSLLGEWIFPFWGGLGNAGGVAPLPAYSEHYTLQMLSGMVEGRYWFARTQALDKRAWTWGDYNPLNGWFIGLFGGAGLYDAQIGKHGMQGEFYIASGVSFGYAHPIGKNLHLEYSLGAGYIATRYYNYTVMDGHKVVDIREDGKYDRRQQSLIGPTRLKVSLVWLPQFRTKKKLTH